MEKRTKTEAGWGDERKRAHPETMKQVKNKPYKDGCEVSFSRSDWAHT